jgi:hypothetical protein
VHQQWRVELVRLVKILFSVHPPRFLPREKSRPAFIATAII